MSDVTDIIKEALREYVGDGEGIDEATLNAHDQEVVTSLLEEVYAVLGGRDLKYPEHFAFLASDNYLLGYRDALSDMRKAIETEKADG